MSRNRRLMFLTQTHTVWGGMESWVHQLGQRMLAQGWEVYAGLAKGARFSDPRKYAAAHPHLEPVVMDAAVGTESARVAAVVRALRRVDPDVVIPVGIGSALEAMTVSRAANVVLVGSMDPVWIANILEYRDAIDVVVPISRVLEHFLQQELEAAKVHYIRQGVPPPSTPRSARGRHLRVAILSRIEELTKRVMDLARVVDLAGDEIEFHVYGDGPDLDALQSAMRGRARFHGYEPTAELYRTAYPNLDAMLLFSPAEGGPNTIFEAMQNAVVPVSSRYLGSRAEGILVDGENSLLFEVGDVEHAAAHLRQLAMDRPRLERLSVAAKQTVASYTDDEMFRAWIEVIENARPQARSVAPRPLEVSGRLERLLPRRAADLIRNVAGKRYPHRTGWEEWPGTQPANPETLQWIEQELRRLDSEVEG